MGSRRKTPPVEAPAAPEVDAPAATRRDDWRALAMRTLASMAARKGWYDLRAMHPEGCALRQSFGKPTVGGRKQPCDCGMDACSTAFQAIEDDFDRREAPLPEVIPDSAFIAALVDALHANVNFMREQRDLHRTALRDLMDTLILCRAKGCAQASTYEAPAPGHDGCLDFFCSAHAVDVDGAVLSPWGAALGRARELTRG